MSGNGNRRGPVPDSPALGLPMTPGLPGVGLPGYLPFGPGPATRGVPSWDALGPLSQSTPQNRGGIKSLSVGQTLIVADARMVPNVVGQDIAVVLGLEVQGDDLAQISLEPVDSRVRACLSWGLGSAEFRAECDWLNGTVLTVPAEQISVRATYVRDVVGAVDPVACPPVFDLAAGFSYGRAGKNSNPARLTEFVYIPDVGSKATIRIPNFATSFTVVIAEPGTNARIEVYGFGRGLANVVDVVAPMSNVGQFDVENAFPLRNGARFIDVTNTNEFAELRAYVVFGLSL